ncbi:MAG: outer membrane beta-barrel protein, partial [Myxococcota bacterium]
PVEETETQEKTPGFSRGDSTFAAGGAVVFGTADGTGLGVRGELGYELIQVAKLTVGAEFVYYGGENIDFGALGTPLSVDYRVIEFNAIGHYRLFEQYAVTAYGIGGLGFASLGADVQTNETETAPTVEGQSALAVHVGGGADYAFSPELRAFAELRFSVYLGGGSDLGAELSSNAQLGAGVRYSF